MLLCGVEEQVALEFGIQAHLLDRGCRRPHSRTAPTATTPDRFDLVTPLASSAIASTISSVIGVPSAVVPYVLDIVTISWGAVPGTSLSRGAVALP